MARNKGGTPVEAGCANHHRFLATKSARDMVDFLPPRKITKSAFVCLLLFWQHSLHAQPAQQWWANAIEFRTRYYSVKTDLADDHARHLAAHMDLTFESYRKLFKGLKSQTPRSMDLYLFRNQRDYQAVLQAKFNAVGAGSWGMAITRRGETSLVAWEGDYSLTAMESVLQHEGFHQFARYLFPRLPSWANEWLAEVFQRGVEVDGEIVLGEVSIRDLEMLAKATKQRQFRSFAQFFTMDQRVWNQHVQYGQANTNYLQAWSLVHFFLYADRGKYQPAFLKFLVGLNNELPWQEAFVRAYGSPNFKAMEEKWLTYVAGLQPASYRETIRRLDFLAAGVKFLYEQNIYPLSLDQLQIELTRQDFRHTSDMFQQTRVLSGSDAANYRVAAGHQEECSFELVDARGKPISAPRDERKLTQFHRRLARRPLDLVTVGMSPKNMGVSWRRAGKKDWQPIFSANAATN